MCLSLLQRPPVGYKHAYWLPNGGCPDGTRDAAADRLLGRSITDAAHQAPSKVEPRTPHAARAANLIVQT